jgi:transposase
MSEAAVQTEWVAGEEFPPPSAGPAPAGMARVAPRLKAVDRKQLMLRPVDVERLIEEDHPARAIWAFTGRMDWSRFLASIQAVEGVAGREAWDPRLLASLWIYAYSRGIGSAREVSRRCGYDPGFQWLTGLQEVNYHTLADFRVGYQCELDELFAQTLGLLSAEGLITLERVMHDGTKIKACAGADSFRREERIRAHLEAARGHVAAMGDPRVEPSARQRAARQRALRERTQRLEQALEELAKIRDVKAGSEAKAQARVSQTEPEARIMKQGDGGFAPSYNAQISTDAAHGLIVGAGLTQCGSDYGELVGAVERIEQGTGRWLSTTSNRRGNCSGAVWRKPFIRRPSPMMPSRMFTAVRRGPSCGTMVRRRPWALSTTFIGRRRPPVPRVRSRVSAVRRTKARVGGSAERSKRRSYKPSRSRCRPKRPRRSTDFGGPSLNSRMPG